MADKLQELEMRLASLEKDQVLNAKNHTEVMVKLEDISLSVANTNLAIARLSCPVHAAKMIRFEQDIKTLQDEQKATSIRMAVWSGAFAALAFLAGKIFK